MKLKSNNGKVASITLISILIAFIIFGIVISLAVNADKRKEGQALADGFTISNYDVTLDVKENNVVNVLEEIGTDWNEPGHHGIYRFIPEWLEYTGKNGKTIKRKAKVLNLRAIDEQYSTDIVNKKVRIKIGDPNRTIRVGEKEYQIQYQYDMGSDPYKDGDEFIFHAFGDFWGTEIKNPSLKINMPKKFDSSKIKFFADKYRKEDVTEYVNYYTSGNTIYAYFLNDKYHKDTGKRLENSLTIDIELPEGYFEEGSWNYGVGSLIISVIIIILTIIVIIWWLRYGKDLKKQEQTIEFYPPDDLSSAEIGYIYGNKNSKKLTISLLISLATKKYIKIDNIEDNKIQITSCLGEKPKAPENIEKKIEARSVEINKLKSEDENISKDAKTMMKFMFKNGEKKRILNSNFEKFDKVKNELVSGGYIEIVSDNDKSRWEGQENKVSEYNKEINEYENKLKIYNNKLEMLQPLNEYEKIVYDILFEREAKVILSEHLTFYTAFGEVTRALNNNIEAKINDSKASKIHIFSVIITIAIMMLNILSYFVIEDLSPSMNGFYIISFASIFVCSFFSIIMERKTSYGEYISAKIKGFRNFLNTTEKYRLEELIAENPEYFYNILPYTYVLGISKKWINKFEKISIPNLDMGNFDYISDSAWNSFYRDVYTPTPSGGGSGGSCGGGCSSCGGGCSSCGGGGSW